MVPDRFLARSVPESIRGVVRHCSRKLNPSLLAKMRLRSMTQPGDDDRQMPADAPQAPGVSAMPLPTITLSVACRP